MLDLIDLFQICISVNYLARHHILKVHREDTLHQQKLFSDCRRQYEPHQELSTATGIATKVIIGAGSVYFIVLF